jgi:hypothetical protein
MNAAPLVLLATVAIVSLLVGTPDAKDVAIAATAGLAGIANQKVVTKQ